MIRSSPPVAMLRAVLARIAFGTLVIGPAALSVLLAQAAPVDRTLTPAQMKADLDVFRAQFLAVDQSYSDRSRERAVARLSQLERSLSEVSPARFELTLAQIVALADNGHTVAFPGPRSRRFDRVRIRLTPFGEHFHVLRARDEHSELLGARVVAVDGVPIETIRATARTLSGGLPAWRDRSASYFIESPEQMHALGLIDDRRGAVYELETSAGERIERLLEAGPASEERAHGGSNRWLFPELAPEELGSWQTLLPADQAPWSLRDVDRQFRSRDAPELDATVIELRRNSSSPGRAIGTALRDLTAAIEAGDRPHLVVDMRLNGGGDLNTTRSFMKSLPDLVSGRIFVLMSPWTFSAAISSVGYLKQEAPSRVTLVGEGPGDRLEFFAEGGVVTLPNTGARILSATERHDYRTGCRDKPDCHRPVVRNPIAVPSLAPQIQAPWTFEAYAQGRDPAIEAVAAALRSDRH